MGRGGGVIFKLSPQLFQRIHLWVRLSQTNKLSEPPCANLTDVTLADEETNPILTDNANKAIQGNVALHVG